MNRAMTLLRLVHNVDISGIYSMATLQEFKTVISDYSSQELSQIATQYINESAKAVQSLIAEGKDQGLDLTSEDDSIEYSENELEAASNLLNGYKGAENVYKTLIEKGSEKGIELTPVEIEGYLQEMAAGDEFNNIELGDEALAQVSGGAWFLAGLAAKALAWGGKKMAAKAAAGGAFSFIAPTAILKPVIKRAAKLPWYCP